MASLTQIANKGPQIDSRQWIFITKNNEPIICKWCDSSDLEAVRPVYIEGFLHHDFLEETDDDRAKRKISDVWSSRIIGYIPKLDKLPPEAFFATAKKCSRVVGFVIFEIREFRNAYVTPLVVHPSMQGSGLGKELIFSILRRMPDLRRISLITMRSNDNAINFYRHIGFTEFHDTEDHPGHTPDELIAFERFF